VKQAYCSSFPNLPIANDIEAEIENWVSIYGFSKPVEFQDIIAKQIPTGWKVAGKFMNESYDQ
jgi:hypothetical protein